MIALDTNVIVRALTRDEPIQARKAAAIFASGRLFIPKTVLVELDWVLRKAYGFAHPAVNDALSRLVGLDILEVEDRSAVIAALAWHADGIDFADALHLASSASALELCTFDSALAKRASRVGTSPRVRLL